MRNERYGPMSIPNVLADRYASTEMVALFDPVNRVRTERRFWVAVLSAQIAEGLPVDPNVVADYERVLDDIDLASIRERELITKHDVKARLEEFCALAGHEDLHKGLTSRDATENVEQLLSWQALELVRDRTVAALVMFAELAARYSADVLVARTHNVPAQPTTMGKRFAALGEELFAAYDQLEDYRRRFSLRGIKGPVGSQQDQIDLLGSPEAALRLERSIVASLGVSNVWTNVGQVYPRSQDYALVSTLVQLAAAPANLALQVRLMAGHDLATEGFRPGQVGSSAMPHKMNTRSCERISGLSVILKGHLAMAAGLSGDQWNEGDVSCSVVRRVVLPDSFFTIDGIFETLYSVLGNFGIFPAVVEAELEKYLPFLATPTLLMHAVRNGLGREQGHELIKHHAVSAALAMREQGTGAVGLIERLGDDDDFPGSADELSAILANPSDLLGAVDAQIAAFVDRVGELARQHPVAAAYRGSDVL